MMAKVHLIRRSQGNNFPIVSLWNIFSKDEYERFLDETPMFERQEILSAKYAGGEEILKEIDQARK